MDPETDSWRPSTSRADPLSERARPPYRLRDRAVDQPRGGELERDGAVVVSVAVVVEPECARRAFAKPDIPQLVEQGGVVWEREMVRADQGQEVDRELADVQADHVAGA
jgi:hypothetical protein